jgi:hypothetical protein
MDNAVLRVNYGTLEIEISVNDPKAFTRPLAFNLIQRLMPDIELIEFVCVETIQARRISSATRTYGRAGAVAACGPGAWGTEKFPRIARETSFWERSLSSTTTPQDGKCISSQVMSP